MCMNDCVDLQPEFFAQIETTHIRIVDDVVRTTLHQHFARINDVSTIGESQGLPHIMISYEDANPAVGEVTDQSLDIADSDRVDARERLSWA